MSAATNSLNHSDAKHTHTHIILHIQRTFYKQNDSDVKELIFHHNGGILLVQNCWHKLAASERSGCIPNCEALHVWRFRKREGIYCHSSTEASIYKSQENRESLCGTVGVCTAEDSCWMSVIQMSAIKTHLGIKLSITTSYSCILKEVSLCV